MKFVIADDVYFARKAVEKLILEWDQDSIIYGSCDNGDDVIGVMEKEQADVLIADIRMPGKDGLELSQVIQKTFPAVAVVLVSGYATFDYARTALHNGVRDYLLKPLKKEELFYALDKIRSERVESEKQKEAIKKVQKRAGSFQLLQYLSGTVCSGVGIPKEITSQGDGCFFIAQFLTDSIHGQELSACLTSLCSSYDLMFEDVLHEGCGILFFCGKDRVKVVYDKKIQKIKALEERMRAIGNLMKIGISSLSAGGDSLKQAYSQAQRALVVQLIKPEQRIYLFDNKQGKELFSKEDLHMIRNQLNAQKVKEVKEFCYKHFVSYQGEEVSVMQLEQAYQALLGICYTMDRGCDRILEEEKVYRPLWVFENLNQLVNYIGEIVCCKTDMAESTNKGDIVEEIQQFMEENYYCELSLNELASTKYFMNPNYLGRLFKSRTGMGFSKYLLGLRMKKAEELLECRDMSINEVALLVGYTSPSYFIQNFKKYFGRTPGNQKNKPN